MLGRILTPQTSNIRSEIVKNLVFFDIGGTYSVMKASDDSIDSWNTMFNTRLAYSLKKFFPEYLKPTLALTGKHERRNDRLTGIGSKNYSIFLYLNFWQICFYRRIS